MGGAENQALIFADLCGNCKLLWGRTSIVAQLQTSGASTPKDPGTPGQGRDLRIKRVTVSIERRVRRQYVRFRWALSI